MPPPKFQGALSHVGHDVAKGGGRHPMWLAQTDQAAEKMISRAARAYAQLADVKRFVTGVADARLISLSYWPAKNWLVTTSGGNEAKLWKVDLALEPEILFLPLISKPAP